MLLAVDVGNTQTVLGLFEGERLADSFRLATDRSRTGDELGVTLAALFELEDVDGICLSTTVPALQREWERVAERWAQAPLLTVGPGVKTGIPIRYDDPREVGPDRIVNAVAANERYGAPCIVVDFGTSTNFDIVSPEGEYVGDDGATFRGRPALEKAYGEFFKASADNALEIEVNSMRFPSKDTAVVEGHFKLHTGKKKELVVSRCSFLYAREEGKWLIAIAREWPGDGLSLRDLEWLIGTWEAKRDGMAVETRYEWTANKAFIRCRFSITKGWPKVVLRRSPTRRATRSVVPPAA